MTQKKLSIITIIIMVIAGLIMTGGMTVFISGMVDDSNRLIIIGMIVVFLGCNIAPISRLVIYLLRKKVVNVNSGGNEIKEIEIDDTQHYL